MKIVVYAIMKNEEKHIERFMKACASADRVVILDTGSTDNSAAIARDLGAHVYVETFSPWRFDVARNRSLDLVDEDADLCIALDLDEIMPEDWRDKLEQVWRPGLHRVRYEFAWNHKPDGSPDKCYWAEKIHSRKCWHWKHPVHEVLVFTPPTVSEGDVPLAMQTVDADMLVHHWADDSKPRSSYLPLLELAVQEDPTGDRNMHYLGREYWFKGEDDKALDMLQKHLACPNAKWDHERAASCRFIGAIHSKRGNRQAAMNWFEKAVNECQESREAWVDLVQAHYYSANHSTLSLAQRRKFFTALTYYATRALAVGPIRPRTYITEDYAWGSVPWDMLAIAQGELGRPKEAFIAAWKACQLSPGDARLAANLLHFSQVLGVA